MSEFYEAFLQSIYDRAERYPTEDNIREANDYRAIDGGGMTPDELMDEALDEDIRTVDSWREEAAEWRRRGWTKSPVPER